MRQPRSVTWLPGLLLAVPALGGGDSIDDTSVGFFLEMALKTVEQVERMRRRGKRRKRGWTREGKISCLSRYPVSRLLLRVGVQEEEEEEEEGAEGFFSSLFNPSRPPLETCTFFSTSPSFLAVLSCVWVLPEEFAWFGFFWETSSGRVSLFCALLGATVDTCSCVSSRGSWISWFYT